MGMLSVIDEKNQVGALAAETVAQVAAIKRRMKELKEKEDQLNKAIKEEMEALGLVKVENDEMTITYVAATTSLRFDSKRFKEEHPDEYDEYLMVSPVSSSIRVKLR